MEMELYENVDSKTSQNQRGHSGSERRFQRAAVVCLGLIGVFLLAGLISLCVYCHVSIQRSAAELSTLKANLTEHLQVSDKLSSLTEKSNLTEMIEELERIRNLSKQVKTCPAGWQMFGCSCYLLSDESGTWDKGREDCKNRGADLVVIDSHKEEIFLSGFTRKRSWIGLTDREKEGTWKWIDETPLTLTYWRTLQPDNGGGDPQWGEEDCVEFRGYSSDHTDWNDLSCGASVQWICEKVA